MADKNPNPNPNASLLAALCVSGRDVEIQGNVLTVYELESQMVGLLLLEMEAAANAGVAVLSLLNPDTETTSQYFKSSWWKIGAAAQDVVFTLIAFSLLEVERNEQGIPKANLDKVRRLPVSYIVPLLTAIAEANQSFFDGLQEVWTKAQQKTPGLSSALSGLLGMKGEGEKEQGEAPTQGQSENLPPEAGNPTLPPLSAVAGG